MIGMERMNRTDCGFTEQIVSYFYGELDAADAARVREHLGSCAACFGEHAGIAAVSGSIGEWKAQFDAMPTPVIVVPRPVTAKPEPTIGLFDAIRGWLGGFQALAAASAALLLVAFGLFVYFGSEKTVGPDLVSSNRITATPSVSPTASPSTIETVDKTAAEKVPEASKKSPQVVKVSETKAPAVKTDPRRPAPKRTDRRPAPALIEDDSDEDTTLRLADLFDEIGTELR
jgi:anti-sigma factor RsiW